MEKGSIILCLGSMSCYVILCFSSDFQISVQYPYSSETERDFTHYLSSFFLAVDHVNNISTSNNLGFNISYIWNDTKGSEIESLKIFSGRWRAGTDVFIGPGLRTCSFAARMAAAWNLPLISYVSLFEYFPTIW